MALGFDVGTSWCRSYLGFPQTHKEMPFHLGPDSQILSVGKRSSILEPVGASRVTCELPREQSSLGWKAAGTTRAPSSPLGAPHDKHPEIQKLLDEPGNREFQKPQGNSGQVC